MKRPATSALIAGSSEDVHAANIADFRHRHRLLIGDHSQRLQRLQGEADRRLQALGECAHHVMVLRLGGHPVAARHLADFNAVIFACVVGNERFEVWLQQRAQLGLLGLVSGFFGARFRGLHRAQMVFRLLRRGLSLLGRING